MYRNAPVSEEPIAATLRAWTHRSRRTVAPLLTSTLRDCGCWTRERAGNAARFHVLFEIHLHAVDELYWRLIECGLEFDRKGHCELALLCTLGRHSASEPSLRRAVALRLELTFADELGAATSSRKPLYA